MAARDPQLRQRIARLGALTLHSQVDAREITGAARKAFNDWERKVDPDFVLPIAERKRRAANAKEAYFLGLSLKAAKARAERP